jgi:hypothetical protein
LLRFGIGIDIRVVDLELKIGQLFNRSRRFFELLRAFGGKTLKICIIWFTLRLLPLRTYEFQPASRIILFPVNIILITAPAFTDCGLIEISLDRDVLNIYFCSFYQLFCAPYCLHDLVCVEFVWDQRRWHKVHWLRSLMMFFLHFEYEIGYRLGRNDGGSVMIRRKSWKVVYCFYFPINNYS